MEKNAILAAIDPGTDQNFVGKSGFSIEITDANGSAVSDLNDTVTVSVPYTDADVTAAGVEESKLVFAALTASGSWESFPTTVDTVNNLLTASVTHFSDFGIIGSASASSSGADLTPPAAPSSVVATGGSSNVTLTWTDPTDTDLSRIVILRNSGGATPVSGTPFAYTVKGARTYNDVNVTAGTTYKYILRAEDGDGNVSANVNEVSATVTVATTPPAAPPSSGPGTPPPSTPPAAPPATPPATPSTPPASPAPTADARTAKLTRILAEARRILDASVDTVATAVGATRNTSAEADTDTRLVARVVGASLDAAVRSRILAFVHYGTESTKTLGAGERAGSVASFRAAFGKDPSSSADLEDVVKIANGRFPSQTNPDREAAVATAFEKVYKRAVDRTNRNDDAAVVIMAYGLRQEDGNRNIASERVAIKAFVNIYKKAPTTASDWDIVRAIAYSGATR
jgi:hypothetical protein